MSRLAVFGAGYAGLVTGACFAELGYSVVIRDVDREKVEALRAGRVPFFEPGLDQLLESNHERLAFTLDSAEALEGAEFVFVCVGTPATYAGDADLSAVWTVLDELGAAGRGALLVMKSTVPVGTGEKLRAGLDARGLDHVGYVSCPEFLAEGTAVRDFLEPDRIVIGSFEDADGDRVEALHAGLDAPVVRTDVASAEMIKLAANAFLGTRISFINEIANVCELVGADVEQVARGMGLDKRIGSRYLRAGIGFGGSCLVGTETVLVRWKRRTRLMKFEELISELIPDHVPSAPAYVEPRRLEVLSWRDGAESPEFLPVSAVTSRPYEGDIVEVRTKMGRRVLCTPDHPFLVTGPDGIGLRVKEAADLTVQDWVPVAQTAPEPDRPPEQLAVLSGIASVEVGAADVIVRPARSELSLIGARELQSGIAVLSHPRGVVARSHDILRSGALRLSESIALGLRLEGATLGTARNGTYVPTWITADERFWRIVGLYIAEGHCSVDGRRHRLQWSFHPRDEMDLVDEVQTFWRALRVKTTFRRGATSAYVSVSSRLLAGWWLGTLGLGRNSYEQRLPHLIWTATPACKRALLAGLWRGDGSWSYVNKGPSVVLEYGTVSRELADGILRLLGDLGIVARLKVGRVLKSTRDTYWLTISGADQVERSLDLVPDEQRSVIKASLARQRKRIRPTGYRRHSANAAWLRVTDVSSRPFRGAVYSLEVPEAETFVTTGGLVTHNCFPKDISFLKLLAGNSGYHFQLLNAVIEVNELQKRRLVSKLQKHLGSLQGTSIALLGLAFKPNTDDLREAPSIVLASRLLAEGADVRAWDPVADASSVLKGITVYDSVLEAVRGADAAVIVTEWDELRELARPEIRDAMRTPLLVDGRNVLDPAEATEAGFVYEGMGRPTTHFGGLLEVDEPELRAEELQDPAS